MRRSVHRTQWAAQFAVASELCKRGHQVALTLGNHPAVDLMAISPTGNSFTIDVKGLYKKNVWGVTEKVARKSLFYVFAFVPDDDPNQFFVMTQGEVSAELKKHLAHLEAGRKARGRSLNNLQKFTGLPWGVVASHEGKWKILPD